MPLRAAAGLPPLDKNCNLYLALGTGSERLPGFQGKLPLPAKVFAVQ